MIYRIWVKISAAFAFIILIMMAVVFHFFTIQQLRREREQLQNNMERIAKQIASIRLAETEGWYVYQDWIDNIINSQFSKDLVYIAIVDENREIVAFSLNTDLIEMDDGGFMTREAQLEAVERLAAGNIAEESWNDFDHIPVEIRLGEESLGKVDVGFSLIDFNDNVKKRLWMNVYLITGAIIVGLALSIFMGKRIAKPLNTLSQAMLDVPKGKYDVQVKNKSRDEVGKLARSFNFMTGRLQEKAAIEDFSRDLVFAVDYNNLAQLVTERIVNYMDASQGVLFLLDNPQQPRSLTTAWAFPKRMKNRITIPIKDVKDLECLQHNEPFSPERLTDAKMFRQILNRVQKQIDLANVRVITPLISQGEQVGLFFLGPKKDGSSYEALTLSFLTTLSQQSALAIRNSFLLIELTERERLKKELEIARTVQQRLLPVKAPQIPGLEITGFCQPAAEVGGDYFDYFELSDDRLGVAIADVTGKGTSAAFYMAELKGIMASLAPAMDSPKELLCRLNAHLCDNVDKRIFVTMIYGILNVKTGEFDFVRAGHNALAVKRSETGRDPDIYIPPGLGLGLANDVFFSERTVIEKVKLNPGDTLFFYTDGLSEAMNNDLQEFGEEAIFKVLAKHKNGSVSSLEHTIVRQVRSFVGDAPQHDDITMVLVRLL